MIVKRGDLELNGDERGCVLMNGRVEEAIALDRDEMIWLLVAGLPVVLSEAQPMPSEPTVKVRDASNDEGQIAGQLAID